MALALIWLNQPHRVFFTGRYLPTIWKNLYRFLMILDVQLFGIYSHMSIFSKCPISKISKIKKSWASAVGLKSPINLVHENSMNLYLLASRPRNYMYHIKQHWNWSKVLSLYELGMPSKKKRKKFQTIVKKVGGGDPQIQNKNWKLILDKSIGREGVTSWLFCQNWKMSKMG